MKSIIFAIRDSKAGYYAPPFVKPSRGEAERDFTTLSRDAQSTVNKYPEDFDLYELGVLDTATGKIAAHDTPQHMMKAVDVYKIS